MHAYINLALEIQRNVSNLFGVVLYTDDGIVLQKTEWPNQALTTQDLSNHNATLENTRLFDKTLFLFWSLY